MKNLLLIIITLILSSLNVYSADKLNSHEQFETGPLPVIINYDPEFRPPMPMPLSTSEISSDDDFYDLPIATETTEDYE
ncbi:MAG: hypothetical protein QM504_01320 [Pseudomonadota bacterium]